MTALTISIGRYIRGGDLLSHILERKCLNKVLQETTRNPNDKRKILEIVYRDYSKKNVMAHFYCVIDMMTKRKNTEERYEGLVRVL